LQQSDIDLGITVPVLDEREALGALLDDISASLAGGRYTICIVDDGSSDGTVELVEERARADPRVVLLRRVKTRPGCRRGGASRAGMEWLLSNTTHSLLSDVDADGANRPRELVLGATVAAAEQADVVIASKYVSGSVVTGRPLARTVASRVYNAALRVLLDSGIRDYSNSFRIYRRDAALLLTRFDPVYDTPTYLIEMVAIWLSHGLHVVEMPTEYAERRTGNSKVVPADLLRGAVGAFHVGLLYRTGAFGRPAR
jgi:dolichol-phosphate mannosyltransferase